MSWSSRSNDHFDIWEPILNPIWVPGAWNRPQNGLNIDINGIFSQPYSLLGSFLTKTNVFLTRRKIMWVDRYGYGGMVKDHTLALFNFWTLPLSSIKLILSSHVAALLSQYFQTCHDCHVIACAALFSSNPEWSEKHIMNHDLIMVRRQIDQRCPLANFYSDFWVFFWVRKYKKIWVFFWVDFEMAFKSDNQLTSLSHWSAQIYPNAI